MIKHILDNGLTVLIEERPASPVVAIVTHVKTGYFDEPDRLAGISHVIEHMFFKGTHRRPGPEDIACETKALGGILNAGTGYESTTYYVVVPKENFERALDIQFDALTDPMFDQDELGSETEVVIQEARQKLDNPSAFSTEKMWEMSFDRHRIRRWRIGYPDDLRAITRDDVLEYYRSRYSPDNIILSIVGGVESGLALQLVEGLFSGMSGAASAESPSPEEPEQTEMKYLRLRGAINQKLLHIGFHAPPVLNSDYYPLSVAVDILGDGRSSRLYQSIMEKRRLVSSIGAYYSAYRDVGVVTISAEVMSDDPKAVAAAVFEEIEKLKVEPIRRSEMEKIKNIIESGYFFEQEQVLGRANRLAYFEALGDFRLSDEFVDRLNAVTGDDVARVVAKYLTVGQATVLEYVPNAAELSEYDADQLATDSESAVASVSIRTPQPTVSADGNVRRAVLPSGTVMVTEVDPASPVVGLGIFFRGGRLCETADLSGITELALRGSLKGTTRYSAEDTAHRIESLGTSIGTGNGLDFFGYSLRVLSKNFDEAFDLLSEVIAEPVFPEAEVMKEREALRADIRRVKDSSFGYAADLLAEAAFEGHPYGLPDLGLDEAVAGMGRDQVAVWHTAMCSPETAVVSIVGDIHIDAVTKSVEALMQRLGKRPPMCAPIPAVFPHEIRVKSVERQKAQTAAAIGFPGLTASDPGRYVLDATASLTSGLGGRLFAEVRGRLGLAYVVSSSNQTAACGGLFAVYTATSPENEEKARDAIFSELMKLREEPAEVDEVERAKNYLLGAKLISLQTSIGRARERAANELYGRGLSGTDDFLAGIARVTPEDILNASRRHFSPSRYCLGVVRGESSA